MSDLITAQWLLKQKFENSKFHTWFVDIDDKKICGSDCIFCFNKYAEDVFKNLKFTKSNILTLIKMSNLANKLDFEER